MGGSVAIALLLSTLAGLSTTIGSLLAIFVRKPGSRFMALTLGFSAGVMILLSFMELLAHGIETVGFVPAYAAFFVGMFIMFVLDVLIPHQYLAERAPADGQQGGLLAAIAVAIALHNIPEGLAVSVPVYAATGSRRAAFLWSFLAGVAEPVGALVAAILLLPFLSDGLLGLMLSSVAGIMVFISLDELVPVARSFGEAHVPIIGVVMGMAVMVVSLWLLRG
jgi:ZIP family zinc transporter